MSRRSRTLQPAVVLASLCALLTACADTDAGADAGRAADEQSSSSTPTPTPTEGTVLPGGVLPLPEPDPGEEAAVLDAGRYRVPLSESLSFDVDLPSGTEVNGEGLYLIHRDTILKVEAAGEGYGIPSDPCTGFADIAPAGQTVDDLVQAIRNQPPYRASRAVPVELGKAVGKHLELRIPSGFDASSCVGGQVGLPGNSGSNNTMAPGYVGQWWILDAEGQRAVVQTFCDQCDDEGPTPLTRAVQDITFTPTT